MFTLWLADKDRSYPAWVGVVFTAEAVTEIVALLYLLERIG